jgi:nucleotide-binding universal stress UspA family protein
MPGILVGVDGSDHSRRALGWAIREAAQHHIPLTVMNVTPRPPRPATHVYWNMPELPEGGLSSAQARASVQEFVDKVAHEVGETTADVTITVVTGDPAQELVRASHDADLLVVGHRGTGGFPLLRLGSVSSKVTHHAACPTVVVPAARQAPHDRADVSHDSADASHDSAE